MVVIPQFPINYSANVCVDDLSEVAQASKHQQTSYLPDVQKSSRVDTCLDAAGYHSCLSRHPVIAPDRCIVAAPSIVIACAKHCNPSTHEEGALTKH